MNEMKIRLITHCLEDLNQFNCREDKPIHPHCHFYMPVGSWITTVFLENSNPLCMSSTQRRTNDDELSAWCKLHGSDFAGKLIPYGARVNYKPPKTREAGQLHKFGPDSIPGVFAGYHIGPGMHWSRQYKVSPLSEFVHQNLGDDASKPEHRLLKPHLTEKVKMVTPLTFPCKQEYERVTPPWKE